MQTNYLSMLVLLVLSQKADHDDVYDGMSGMPLPAIIVFDHPPNRHVYIARRDMLSCLLPRRDFLSHFLYGGEISRREETYTIYL